MKFIHLGDLHLGKSVNEFSMIRDQEYILNEILAIILERHADAVLIAGDVYDRSVPSEEAVRVLDDFLAALSSHGVRVLIISGNHDSDERLNFGSRIFRDSGVYIAGKYEGTLPCVKLADAFGTVNFWLLPFVKASLVGHYHPDEDTSTYDAAVRTAIRCGAQVHPENRNVILAHQFVTGPSSGPSFAGSEMVRPETVGTVEQVRADAFDAFDYVALGHIHSPQPVGRATCRYSGSPLKYSLHEIDNDKSVPLVTMGEKGDVQVELIPLHPLHEMRHIKGRIEDLLSRENVVDPKDYMYVTLTDENTVWEAMRRIQQVYPNAMKLDYCNSHTDALENMDFSDVTAGRTFKQIILDFYAMQKGGEPTQEEWNILKDVAQEAGIESGIQAAEEEAGENT